ncbi:hypothetical protein E1261_04830 [Kribbella albertanoniae]|uniref:Uncharacterized protein n=1 Tax=Kribbella albertanoniae TaxID=1266829 RepID=A0A4R4QEW1_9ACTN|nr:hypothetical protein E1261_04830 [Kribbella albertanoniae]
MKVKFNFIADVHGCGRGQAGPDDGFEANFVGKSERHHRASDVFSEIREEVQIPGRFKGIRGHHGGLRRARDGIIVCDLQRS